MPRLLSLESFGSEKAQESVGSLGDLPVEIIEKILEGILEDDPYLVNAPITAGNAVAIDPYVWLSESKSAIQSPKPITKNEFALERGQTGQASEESIAQEGPEAQESVTARTRSNKSVDKTKESLSKLTFDSSRMNGLSVLRNLRVTCRYLSNLCNPFLYREVDLYFRTKDFSSTAKIDIDRFLLRPYGRYVTTLRIRAVHWNRIPAILTDCPNLRSLALYLPSTAKPATIKSICDSIARELQDSVSRQGHRGLTSLGIYSESIVRGLFDRSIWIPNAYDAAQRLLESILDNAYTNPYSNSDSISSTPNPHLQFNGGYIAEVVKFPDTLQVLDIATSCMQADVYDKIRAGFKHLRSLTIRRSLHTGLGKIWEPLQKEEWALNTSLKHSLRNLYLRDCNNVPAWQVPELVRHFTRLEGLAVIACGDDNYVPPRPFKVLSTTLLPELVSGFRPEDVSGNGGWSTLPDALCNVHPPLRTFHIEHMDEEEITAMGVIPVHTLSLISRQLILLLMKDREIFPGLKVLRTYPGTKQDRPLMDPVVARDLTVGSGEGDAEDSEEGEDVARRGKINNEEEFLKTMLENLCKARGVELRYDLPPSKGCGPDCQYI